MPSDRPQAFGLGSREAADFRVTAILSQNRARPFRQIHCKRRLHFSQRLCRDARSGPRVIKTAMTMPRAKRMARPQTKGEWSPDVPPAES